MLKLFYAPGSCALASHVARVRCPEWLDEQHVSLVVGSGAVLDAARHDEELAGSELDRAIAQLDRQAPVQDEEEVVRIGMRVPHELALGLHDLDLEAV